MTMTQVKQTEKLNFWNYQDTFAGHLAFTMAFDMNYVFPMIVGKLVAGVSAVFLAVVIDRKIAEKSAEAETAA